MAGQGVGRFLSSVGTFGRYSMFHADHEGLQKQSTRVS